MTGEKTRLWLLIFVGVVATLLGQTHAQEIFAPSPPVSGVFATQTQASTGENYDRIQCDALDSLLAANSGALSSRLAPGGGLMAHENAGGHLLARHVGQTDAQLAARLAGNPRLPAASTFATRAEAEAAISGAFDHNAAQLSNWMGGGAQGRLILNAPFSGGSVLQSGAFAAAPGTGVRAVLPGNGSGAYNILTGFPTP